MEFNKTFRVHLSGCTYKNVQRARECITRSYDSGPRKWLRTLGYGGGFVSLYNIPSPSLHMARRLSGSLDFMYAAAAAPGKRKTADRQINLERRR